MTGFDVLSIIVLFAIAAALSVAAVSMIRGQGARALGILGGCAVCAVVYLGIVVLVSLFWPRRVLQVGEPRCFYEWCIAVEGVHRTPGNAGVSYVVNLRLSSSARVAQRNRNVIVYLTDDRGRRYDPAPADAAAPAVPIDALLQPGESIEATRVFDLPADAQQVGLVIARHEGGFPIGWFIIGEEAWFRKPAIVYL